MSSIPTRAQQQALSEASGVAVTNNYHSAEVLKEKRQKFVRSTSIERIIQFNSFICSQNYFILPALIAWLKTSQTILHSHIEKCITFIKSLFITSLIYKVFVAQIRTLGLCLDAKAQKCYFKAINSDFVPALEMLAFIVHHSVSSLIGSAKKKLFSMAMYFTVLLIFLQLATCIFFMSKVFLPAGLIFLFVCLYLISHLNVSVLFYYLKNEENKLLAVRSEKRPRKFVLGKKTISNLNLF